MKMNENVFIATVEDWMGKELIRFEGKDSSWQAIEWREEQGRKGKTEEEENGILEDLYVIGYDENENQVVVQFG